MSISGSGCALNPHPSSQHLAARISAYRWDLSRVCFRGPGEEHVALPKLAFVALAHTQTHGKIEQNAPFAESLKAPVL